MTVSNVTTSAATLEWSGSKGDIILDSATVASGVSSPYKLGDLASNTTYTVKISNRFGESKTITFTTKEITYKEVTLNLDFKNKTAANLLSNPNSAYAPSLKTLILPSQITESIEFSDTRYNQLSELDDSLVVIERNSAEQYAQVLFNYNVVEGIKAYDSEFFIRYGANSLVDEIAVAKEKVKSIVANVWGCGSGALSGVRANRLLLRVYGLSTWEKYSTMDSNDVKQMRAVIDPAFIDEKGCSYVLPYAYSSDGSIASTLTIDYANLEITILVEED